MNEIGSVEKKQWKSKVYNIYNEEKIRNLHFSFVIFFWREENRIKNDQLSLFDLWKNLFLHTKESGVSTGFIFH